VGRTALLQNGNLASSRAGVAETPDVVLIALEAILVTANLRVPASPCRGFDERFTVAVGPFGVM
jgi:hypothetical protein